MTPFRSTALAGTLALGGLVFAALPASAAGEYGYGPYPYRAPTAVTYYYGPYPGAGGVPTYAPYTTYSYAPNYAPPAPGYYADRGYYADPGDHYVPPGLSIRTPLGTYAPFYGGYSPYSSPMAGGYNPYRLTPDR